MYDAQAEGFEGAVLLEREERRKAKRYRVPESIGRQASVHAVIVAGRRRTPRGRPDVQRGARRVRARLVTTKPLPEP